ncbi:hypothetical protein X777_16116 [Ooceraea biroi]|uniref:Uncharacterized protein n=1 Tax=Ooceraea biroi TaxID=2015173 RepID=A0A026WVB8_OOCBI|nr:hypothetical protein X777_16116 [Ooceraea biroi]
MLMERSELGERQKERNGREKPWSGDREGYRGGGSASNEESQRLTKKKGRTLQFIDRPAVRAATRGCARDEARRREGPAGLGVARNLRTTGKSPETTRSALFFPFFSFSSLFFQDRHAIGVYYLFSSAMPARASDARHKNFMRRRGSVASWRNRRAKRTRASERVFLGAEETTCTFFRILAIFYATSHALYGCANRHKYGLTRD